MRELSTTTAQDYVNLISVRGGEHSLAATLAGLKGEPRIVMVDDHTVDVPPSRHMVLIRNDDRPGVIGVVGIDHRRRRREHLRLPRRSVAVG